MSDRSETRKYEPSRRLASFHIKGFQYWDGALVLGKLKVGDELELVAESDNPFDPDAIAIYFDDIKLGYIYPSGRKSSLLGYVLLWP